jgi:cytochrome c peroxidase
LGITGFDSPIAQKSIPEAAALENRNSIKSMQITQPKLFKVLKQLKKARILKTNTNFNAFDRAFIREIANPLSIGLYKTQVSLNILL